MDATTPATTPERSANPSRWWWSKSVEKPAGDDAGGKKDEEDELSIQFLVPQFIRSLAPKQESALKAKSDVIMGLERRREKLREQVRKAKAAALAATGGGGDEAAAAEQMVSDLDAELKRVVSAYVKPIVDAATTLAKAKVNSVVPKDVEDLGVPLPIRSDQKLEEAIEKKRRAVAAQLMKFPQLMNYHYTWYMSDKTVGFDAAMAEWAARVRRCWFAFDRVYHAVLFLNVHHPHAFPFV